MEVNSQEVTRFKAPVPVKYVSTKIHFFGPVGFVFGILLKLLPKWLADTHVEIFLGTDKSDKFLNDELCKL